MTYLAISLVAVWCCGALFLAGRTLNFIRLVYNNLAPGKTLGYPDYLRFFFWRFRFMTDANGIGPEHLTEAGRQYRKKAIRNDWFFLAWALSGFVLLPWASSYF